MPFRTMHSRMRTIGDSLRSPLAPADLGLGCRGLPRAEPARPAGHAPGACADNSVIRVKPEFLSKLHTEWIGKLGRFEWIFTDVFIVFLAYVAARSSFKSTLRAEAKRHEQLELRRMERKA